MIAALIGRQDAMAHRTAGKIRAFLDEHVPLALVELSWARMCHRARTRLERIPDDYVARHPDVVGREPAVHAVLRQLAREALTELADEFEGPPMPEEIAAERAAVKADPVLQRPRVVSRSHTLAAARAQSARLATQLIQLKQRVVPYDHPVGRRGRGDGAPEEKADGE